MAIMIAMGCCGIREASNVGTDWAQKNGNSLNLIKQLVTMPAAFYVLSLAEYQWDRCMSGAQSFEAYIKENNLGELKEVGVQRNPNTGQNIRMWVFQTNITALQQHIQQESAPKPAVPKQATAQTVGEAIAERREIQRLRSLAARRGWATRRANERALRNWR